MEVCGSGYRNGRKVTVIMYAQTPNLHDLALKKREELEERRVAKAARRRSGRKAEGRGKS